MSNDLTLIPLNRLIRSSLNVRKTGADSIDDLAASIAVHGLLQNLTVTKSTTGKAKSKAGDIYEVVAGGPAGWPRSNLWRSRRRSQRITPLRAKL
jgi:ParB-like chromosome segregation protein Spo0J